MRLALEQTEMMFLAQWQNTAFTISQFLAKNND